MSEKLDPGRLTPENLAKLLTASTRESIMPNQVVEIAEAGELLAADGTINLIRYTAFLIQENAHAE